jgi:hypothetical protein
LLQKALAYSTLDDLGIKKKSSGFKDAYAAECGVAIHHLKSTSTPPQKTAAQFFVNADPFSYADHFNYASPSH